MGNTVPRSTCFLLPKSRPKSVKVVDTDGKVQIYSALHVVTVAYVLQSHPQHCVTEAGQEKNICRGVMLRDEEVLKPGTTYVILPLPPRFGVASKRRPRRPSISSSCWFCIATGGFSVSDWLSDDSDNGQLHSRDVEPPASLIAMEKSFEEISNSPIETTRSPSQPTLNLNNFLKSAGIEWKEISDGNRSWRPDLESIKEESMKFLLPRQCLAELIQSEQFLALLKRKSEESQARG